MEEKGHEECESASWPGAPEESCADWWNLFIACGQVVYLMLEQYRHGFRGDEPLLLEFLERKAGRVANLPPSEMEAEARQVAGLARAHRSAASRVPYLQRLAIALLTRDPQKTFPFLRNEAAPVPGPAALLAAAICALHVYEGRGLHEDAVRAAFQSLDRRPHRWREFGAELASYCSKPGALLEFSQQPMGICGLDGSVNLSSAGYATLLSIECPEGMGVTVERVTEFEDNRRRTKRSERIRKFVEGEQKNRAGEPGQKDISETRVTGLSEPKHGLDSVALPGSIKDDLSLVVALCKKAPESAPTLLFYGPPGTGKTYGAGAMAGTLGRPLATVALARIYNRYVGETEKALESAFAEAEKAGAVLLLDEADGLLQSRDSASHQWEIASVNVLLKLLEKPKVPVVLCTNLLPKLDPALHRRIHHLLEFPIPEDEERGAIWALELKRAGLGKKLDLRRLAEVPLTGGLVANAVAQARNRRLLLGSRFKVTTEVMLELAWKEAPKLGQAADRHRIAGFGA